MGNELENKCSHDLQVRTSFAQNNLVLLIYVKKKNGGNEFEKKIISIDPSDPFSERLVRFFILK